MKTTDLKRKESLKCQKTIPSKILPDSIAKIMLLLGFLATIVCIILGLEGDGNE